MNKSFDVKNIDDLVLPARELIHELDSLPVWAFYGEMGAGKTTFIQQICHQLNVKEQVGSPTFNLINEYETLNGRLVYHFDFYRLDTIEEALEIGSQEYFDSGNLCLIEWPEKVEQLLPDGIRKIKIELGENNSRTIKVTDYE